MRNRGAADTNDLSNEHITLNYHIRQPSSWFSWCRKRSKDSNQLSSGKPLCDVIFKEPDKQSRKCFSWCRKKARDMNGQVLSKSPRQLLPFTDADTTNVKSLRRFTVMGIDIDAWSPQSQYIFITCGVMLFLLLYGYLQELVVMNKFKRSLGWFVTLLQLSGYAICAAFQNRVVHGGKSERRIPMRYYIVLSILQVLMQGLTNISMHYLNYPAKTLFKSSRVIVTMLFGIIFLGRKYQPQDYAIGLCMVLGLTTFVAADANSSPAFDSRGVMLVLGALAADAAILNLQEHCMHVFSAGHDELVYLSNVGAACVALCLSLGTGELTKGLMFLRVIGSVHVFGLFMAFSCAGFLGVSCLAALTKRFGALTSAITSVVRKGLTLIVSYIVFPEGKALTSMHVLGAMIFMGSLLLKSVSHQASKGLGGGRTAAESMTMSPSASVESLTLPSLSLDSSFGGDGADQSFIGERRHSRSAKDLPLAASAATAAMRDADNFAVAPMITRSASFGKLGHIDSSSYIFYNRRADESSSPSTPNVPISWSAV